METRIPAYLLGRIRRNGHNSLSSIGYRAQPPEVDGVPVCTYQLWVESNAYGAVMSRTPGFVDGGDGDDKGSRRANPIDVHVGSRVRLRRMLLGMSQEKLGEKLGLRALAGAIGTFEGDEYAGSRVRV